MEYLFKIGVELGVTQEFPAQAPAVKQIQRGATAKAALVPTGAFLWETEALAPISTSSSDTSTSSATGPSRTASLPRTQSTSSPSSTSATTSPSSSLPQVSPRPPGLVNQSLSRAASQSGLLPPPLSPSTPSVLPALLPPGSSTFKITGVTKVIIPAGGTLNDAILDEEATEAGEQEEVAEEEPEEEADEDEETASVSSSSSQSKEKPPKNKKRRRAPSKKSKKAKVQQTSSARANSLASRSLDRETREKMAESLQTAAMEAESKQDTGLTVNEEKLLQVRTNNEVGKFEIYIDRLYRAKTSWQNRPINRAHFQSLMGKLKENRFLNLPPAYVFPVMLSAKGKERIGMLTKKFADPFWENEENYVHFKSVLEFQNATQGLIPERGVTTNTQLAWPTEEVRRSYPAAKHNDIYYLVIGGNHGIMAIKQSLLQNPKIAHPFVCFKACIVYVNLDKKLAHFLGDVSQKAGQGHWKEDDFNKVCILDQVWFFPASFSFHFRMHNLGFHYLKDSEIILVLTIFFIVTPLYSCFLFMWLTIFLMITEQRSQNPSDNEILCCVPQVSKISWQLTRQQK